ncbi:hypothetical protein ASPSYDRAFT_46402 [Aspergillus sydowii CBS 593.65]|uniref:homogentisate 1,2-dioxygenase n=1 Tax=Aspergillus sydowii CBS 593.65 TaxID=1036612 RepID=A0A1L9TG67_9EURO|nr:uncharacterized protein ASPSYDRAFT_46402 [Aspergillus sydowii CBS 593.65]OJJ58385.1 hypothetical protein ASPSYDRAFT_46402 [Aspergillus sydowii CBS 593.65]
MESVSFNHPDPSIYTILMAPSARPGTAATLRWLVVEDTFPPPWLYRDVMPEFSNINLKPVKVRGRV